MARHERTSIDGRQVVHSEAEGKTEPQDLMAILSGGGAGS
jgi:hypothetical protein